MIAQRRELASLTGGAANAPPVALTGLERPTDSLSTAGGIVQRVVTKSTAPWGDLKGKWVTSLNTSRGFDTQEQAQQYEDELLEVRELAQEQLAQQQEREWQVEANGRAWMFADQQGRLTAHFGDGWGESYNITSYDQLRERILASVDRDDEETGTWEIDLGDCRNLREHMVRPCKILYEVEGVVTVIKGPIHRQTVKRRVYHCGPTSQ
ncbi:hypothetical protein CDN98_07315 [Roseateles terrae]|nr:hypothetical protein CDN98_07315 [Roseateles terrae]